VSPKTTVISSPVPLPKPFAVFHFSSVSRWLFGSIAA